MKKITLTNAFSFFIALFCAVNFGFGQTTLAAGDIAITGVNSDNPDQFSFVLLKDVVSGTQINFTDNGWQSSGNFRANEGTITWTASSDLSCGTQIIITDLQNPFSASIGTVTDSNQFQLSSLGDQILAYQGLSTSPQFLYAIQFGNNTGWVPSATTSNNSAVPTGLTNGVNAVNIGNIDNGTYNCSTTSSASAILASVSDATNWNGDDNVLQTLGDCVFSCSLCPTNTTWTSGAWSNGLPNSLSKAVVINDDYDTSSGDITGCSLTVNAGATLTVSNGTFVEVENDVNVNGTIEVQTQGAFIQNDDAGSFNLIGSGTASVNKITPTKAKWYYYTYWSSPVENATTNGVFPNVDGDRRFWFNANNFKDEHTNGTTNGNPDDVDDNGNDWQYSLVSNGTNAMTPGVGFAITEARSFTPGSTGTAPL
ncbi:hypothetical protein ACFSKN_15425 [Mariniflexile gromovii]|uniref:Ig-like domain-containing protein n=1 Tax=Mariniflexile gromovii TaxID=362523 RepID=A0ABS4BYW5_9FLAO|nr:hypothetical protein [Mariniflexile gromovii]MBP0905777.1 hypothetical protein [Mariniflexile gromovii]